jgi:hypothetical protein
MIVRLFFSAAFAVWGSATALAVSPELTTLIISVI